MRSIVIVLLASLALPVTGLGADPALVAAIDARLRDYGAYGRYELPDVSREDVAALAAGEPVVWQLKDLPDTAAETNSMGIVGVRVVDVPRLLVWLTALGGNESYRSEDDVKSAGRSGSRNKSRVTHSMLSMFDDGSYTRYQHVNLPWPFKDRHWVIYCEKNLAAAEQSADRVWEHTWKLEANGLEQVTATHAREPIDGLTEKMLAKSIYLPANQGAWIMADLGDDRTLLMAYMDVHLGGNFPSGIVRRFTQKQLKSGLDMMAGLAARVAAEYDEEPPIYDGNGRFIQRSEAESVAAAWRENTRLAVAVEHPHP